MNFIQNHLCIYVSIIVSSILLSCSSSQTVSKMDTNIKEDIISEKEPWRNSVKIDHDFITSSSVAVLSNEEDVFIKVKEIANSYIMTQFLEYVNNLRVQAIDNNSYNETLNDQGFIYALGQSRLLLSDLPIVLDTKQKKQLSVHYVYVTMNMNIDDAFKKLKEGLPKYAQELQILHDFRSKF